MNNKKSANIKHDDCSTFSKKENFMEDSVLYKNIAKDIMENRLGMDLKISKNKKNINLLAEFLEKIDAGNS